MIRIINVQQRSVVGGLSESGRSQKYININRYRVANCRCSKTKATNITIYTKFLLCIEILPTLGAPRIVSKIICTWTGSMIWVCQGFLSQPVLTPKMIARGADGENLTRWHYLVVIANNQYTISVFDGIFPCRNCMWKHAKNTST